LALQLGPNEMPLKVPSFGGKINFHIDSWHFVFKFLDTAKIQFSGTKFATNLIFGTKLLEGSHFLKTFKG
jgi:hypothetical protein